MSQLINLLPEDQLRLLKIERYNRLGTMAIVTAGLVMLEVILVLIGLLGATAAMRSPVVDRINKAQSRIGQLNQLGDGGAPLEQQAKVLQQQLQVIGMVLSSRGQVDLGQVLDHVNQVIPSDVHLTQLTIGTDKSVTLSGEARSYGSAAKFMEALKENGGTLNRQGSDSKPFFENVHPGAIQQSGTVTFSVTFNAGGANAG